MPTHRALRTSFTLPDRLTVGQYAKYSREIIKARREHGETVETVIYYAIVFGAAIEANIIGDWKSEVMPSLAIENEEDVDAAVAMWAGEEISRYMTEQFDIPKALFWRRLMQWIVRVSLRQN